jgi:hypothetical protein
VGAHRLLCTPETKRQLHEERNSLVFMHLRRLIQLKKARQSAFLANFFNFRPPVITCNCLENVRFQSPSGQSGILDAVPFEAPSRAVQNDYGEEEKGWGV